MISRRTGKRLACWLGFAAVFLLSALFRDMIASRDLAALERATGARFAPFLVESAMMESYINRVADRQSIAGPDPALPAMAHRPVAEQMTLGLEYAGGWTIRAYRIWHGTPPTGGGEYERSYAETRFLRRTLTVFLALVPAFLYLMMLACHVPWFIALPAALLEAVSAAAIGRYTGQDLIKGAFAFPFLAAYLAASAGALRSSFRRRRWALAGVWLSAFLAAAFWDASQILIGTLALAEAVRLVCGGTASRKRRDLWLTTFLALALAALLPYQSAHGSFFSPVLQFALPAALLLNWLLLGKPWLKLKRFGVLLGLAVWCTVLAGLSPFSGNYSHFGELLAAKLRFWNTLPADPELLTFDQRFLWTPELHSTDVRMLAMLFPAVIFFLIVFLAGVLIRWKKLRAKRRFQGSFLVFTLLTLVGFVATVYFARFRSAAALFAAPLLALSVSLLFVQGRRGFRWIWVMLLVLVTVLEGDNTCKLRRVYPEGLKATAELIKYLRCYDLGGKVILTDMQFSPLVKCYTNGAILIQPKYELPEVRNLMRDYLELFFTAPIARFEEFCTANHVDYLIVHCPTVTTPMEAPYSYRYMTCTKQLKRNSAAAILTFGVNGMAKHFSEIPLPEAATGLQGYRMYRFIAPEARERAGKLAEEAMEAYYLGNRKKAARLIRKAYRLAPGRGEIYESYAAICRTPPPPPALPKRKAK